MANESELADHQRTTARALSTFNVKIAKRPKRQPVVYFVEAECGLIKIGTTSFLEFRMKDLQAQCPVPLTLLATVRGDRATEHEYHRRFAAHRAHGEWFTRCPEIEAEIARLTPARRRSKGGS